MMHGVSRARVPASRVLLVAAFGAFLAFLDATIVNVAFPVIRESFPDVRRSATCRGCSTPTTSSSRRSSSSAGDSPTCSAARRAFVAGVVVFTVASAAVRGCAVRRAAGRRTRRPGARSGAPRPGLARAGGRGVPGGAARPRRRALGRGRGPRRRPRSTARVAPWSSSGAGAGRSWSTCRSAWPRSWAARRPRREPRARACGRCPTSAARPCLAVALGALTLGIVKGNDWGWGSAARARRLRRGGPLRSACSSSARGRTRSPLLDSGAAARSRRSPSRTAAPCWPASGFYAYLLTNILWLQYVWGYSVLRGRTRPGPGRAGRRGGGRPGSARWRTATATATSSCPAPWCGRAPTSGTTSRSALEPAFWSEWMPGQVLSGIGVGATLPLLGSAALAAVPGGRYATASAVVSSARQLGGVLGIAVLVLLLGEPTPATPWRSSTTAGCSPSSRSWRWRSSPCRSASSAASRPTRTWTTDEPATGRTLLIGRPPRARRLPPPPRTRPT